MYEQEDEDKRGEGRAGGVEADGAGADTYGLEGEDKCGEGWVGGVEADGVGVDT